MTTHKATAADLIPIPKEGAVPVNPIFATGKWVLARYPDTTTFYKAEVISFKKEEYTLRFEEDDKELVVERRLVLELGKLDKRL